MKILHLLASPAYTGPAETVTQLALAQRALGHDVTIAVDRKREKLSSEEPIVPRLEPLGLLDGSGFELSVKSTPWAMARDVLRLRNTTVEIVHSHFSHDHTIARLGTPKSARLIRSIHAPRSLRWTLPAAAGFTVPMESLGRKLLGQRVLILPAFVAGSFTPAPGRVPKQTSKSIAMVSAFQPSRRHALGIEAFQALHKLDAGATLTLVGDGELEPALKAQAGSSPISFPGYQSGDAFLKRLQSFDEVWILGLGNDWSARAAAQARACGVRVVAVDEGDLPRYADALTEPTVEAIVAASQSNTHTPFTLERPEAIARRVLAFYERCR